jgi:hypothetical protein
MIHETLAARLKFSDARGLTAWRLSGIAMPMLSLARRLCFDVPSDFHVEWEDGHKYGERAASQRVMDLVRLGYGAGVDAGIRAPDGCVRDERRRRAPRIVV